MRPIYLNYPSVAAAGFVTDPIVLDQYISPGNVTITINLSNPGTLTATAQVLVDFTTDNVLEPQTTTIIWQPYTATPFTASGSEYVYSFSVNAGESAAIEAMFAYAPKAIRVRVRSVTNTPNMSVQVIQLGIGGT